MALPTCGAYTDTRFKMVLPTFILTTHTLSLIRFTCTMFSIHLSATIIPTPATPSSQPTQKNLYLAPSSPIILTQHPLLPFHLVSCKQQKSILLLPTISTTSPLLLVIVSTFTLPILSLQGFRRSTTGAALRLPLTGGRPLAVVPGA